MKFNEKLIKLRKQKNLTQHSLAEKINYSDKVISKWENGYSIPDIQAINALSKFYNITIDELMNDCDILTDKDKKCFPKLPIIFFHIVLLFAPILIIGSILCSFRSTGSITIVPTWDAVMPVVFGIMLVLLSLVDLIFTYLNISRRIVICLIFAIISMLLIFAIIALAMYGRFTLFTKPFIYLIVSIVVNTAYGFLTNKEC